MTAVSKTRGVLGKLGRALIPSTRNYQLVRFEIQSLYIRTLGAIDPRQRRRIRELSGQRGLSLNIGSGGSGKKGWVNIDAFRQPDTTLTMDLRCALPFEDGQVRRVFAEHVIEHLDFRSELPFALSELQRVLEPSGVLRIIVPDTRRFIEAYVSGDAARWRELGWHPLPHDIYTPMHALNHIFHQEGEHKFGYDFETLAHALRRAGFSEVVHQRFGRSLDPDLTLDQEHHKPYSLYVDARK